MPISGFRIINLGNGTSIELNWSVVDLSEIKYFVVDRYDKHLRKWVPFDGFHGIIRAQLPNSFESPYQRITIELEEVNAGQQTFRIKAVDKNNNSSDWTTGTVDVKTISDTSVTTRTYYVLAGLKVERSYQEILVKPGTAMAGGNRVSISNEVNFGELEANKKYIVFISSNGIVSLTEIDNSKSFKEIKTTDYGDECLRLANITVDADGNISIEDTRFLWSPSNLSIAGDPDAQILSIWLEWDEIFELNTNRYKIYRSITTEDIAPSLADYKLIGSVESMAKNLKNEDDFPSTSQTADFEDSDSKVMGFGKKFWYRVSAVDYDENESPLSPPESFSFGNMVVPSAPTRLVGFSGGQPIGNLSTLYNELSWDKNPESDILGYYIYIKRGEYWTRHATVSAPTNTYRHSGLYNGEEYTYAVSAFNSRLESDKSNSVTIKVGDSIRPSVPIWDTYEPLTTGGTSTTVWARLKWNPVTTNDDPLQSAINDLAGYKIYLVETEDGKTIFTEETRVDATQTEALIEYRNSARGTVVKYVISAYDIFGNESYKSTEREVVLGGPRPSAPIFALKNLNLDGRDKVLITITKVKNHDTAIREYKIYKGLTGVPSNVLHVLIDESDPATTELSWTDTVVERGKSYVYTVVAIDDRGNQSEKALQKEILVGDYITPEAPIVTTYGSDIEIKEDLAIIKNWIKFKLPIDIDSGELKDQDLRGVYVYRGISPDYMYEIGYLYISSNDPDLEYEFSHTDNIENGRVYYYGLITEDKSGNRLSLSSIETIEILSGSTAAPEAPFVTAEGVLSVIDSSPVAQIKLVWNQVTDASGYRVYKSTSGNTYSLLQDISQQEVLSYEYIDSSLNNGHKYWYYVVSYNALGVESEGSYVSAKAGDTEGPAAPIIELGELLYKENLTVDIPFSWNSNSDVVKYEILRSEDNGHTYKIIGSTTNNSFSDSINYSQVVKYKVVGYDLIGNRGTLSSDLNVDTKRDSIPLGVNIDSIESQQLPGDIYSVVIKWTPKSLEFFKSFRVYINSEDVKETSRVIYSTSDRSCQEYLINNIRKDKDYYFSVSTVDIFDKESGFELVHFRAKDNEAPGTVSLNGEELELGIRIWWDPVSDIDLAGYSIEHSNDGIEFLELTKVISNSFLNSFSKPTTKYYRVRAYDSSGNYGEYSNILGPLTSKSIKHSSFDQEPPESVKSLVSTGYGINTSESDQTHNVYINLEWEEVLNAAEDFSHYNIYIDGQYFGQTKQTFYTVNNLVGGKKYTVQVTAVDKHGNESSLDDAMSIIVSTEEYNVSVPSPRNGSVKQGIRALFLNWNAPINFPHISEYLIEYVENNGEPPADDDWIELTRSKFTYFSHGRLTYGKKYHYRIKTISTLGKDSEWYLLEGIYEPTKAGNEDLAAGTITSLLLQADTVLAEHISAKAVTFEKIDSNAILAHHINAKAINAEHLNVSIGNRNLIRNSAFGMIDRESGLYGVSWMADEIELKDLIRVELENPEPFVSVVNDSDIPVSDHALRVYSIANKSTRIRQKISIPNEVRYVVFTAYVKATGIYIGDSSQRATIDLYDYDTLNPGQILNESGNTQELLIPANTNGWEKISHIFYIPEGTNSIYLRLNFSNTYGDLRVTSLKLEEGNMATKWTPAPGEIYGSAGYVQINESGILVREGMIKVETSLVDSSSVRINSEGIFAGKKDLSSYAKMTHEGFISVGGMFHLTTAPDTNTISSDSIVIKNTGIFAYGSNTQSANVEINSNGNIIARNGSFTLTTSENALTINSSGIDLKDNEVSIFKVDTVSKQTLIKGNFIISSRDVGLARFEINQDKIRSYNDQGDMTFIVNGSTGAVSIGKGLTISSSGLNEDGSPVSNSNRIEVRTTVDDAGIYGYSSNGELGYRLQNDGKAFFYNGSVTITSGSLDEKKQIVINNTGIYGPRDDEDRHIFKLTDGSNGAVLEIRDAKISQGSVELSHSGLVVNGDLGIKVNDQNKNTIVDINSGGIQIHRSGGIKLRKDPNDSSHGGSITFGEQNNIAIDESGIRADSITVGDLRVDGSGENSRPRIIVGDINKEKVIIDKEGLLIKEGAIIIQDSSGNILMEKGQVSAQALNITGGASNLLRNGRGDYVDNNNIPKYWTVDANVATVVQVIEEKDHKPLAGISGENAIKIVTTQGDQGIYQAPYTDSKNKTSMLRKGRTYTAVWNIYVHSGSAKVCVENTIDTNGKPIRQIVLGAGDSTEKYRTGEWHTVYQRFKVDSDINNAIFSIKSHEDAAVIYATDLMLVEGDFASSYNGHISELNSSGSVMISDGSFRITTIDNTLVIDSDGLKFQGKGSNKKVNFSLNSIDGFKLSTPDSAFEISSDNGILAGNLDGNYVKITEDGLVSNGFFNLEGSTDGYLSITSSEIKLTDSQTEPKNLVTLTPRKGLSVIGSGAIFIQSAPEDKLENNDYQMTIVPNSISIKQLIDGQLRTSLHIGDMESLEKVPFNQGIYIADGSFYLESEDPFTTGIEKRQDHVSISKDGIRFARQKLVEAIGDWEDESSCLINSDGISFSGEGFNYNPFKTKILMSEEPIYADGSTIVFPERLFTHTPKVILIPANMQIYDYTERNKSQFLEFSTSGVTPNSFCAHAKITLDSGNSDTEFMAVDVSYDNGSSWFDGFSPRSLNHNETWMARTQGNAEQLELTIHWKAQKGSIGDLRDYVKFEVAFSYDGGLTWADPVSYRYEGGKFPFGKDNIGTVVIKSQRTDGLSNIRVKVLADINDGHQIAQNSVEVTTIKYRASNAIEITNTKYNKAHWIAIGE